MSQGLWNTENTRDKNLNLILEVCSGNSEAQIEDGGGRDRERGEEEQKKMEKTEGNISAGNDQRRDFGKHQGR